MQVELSVRPLPGFTKSEREAIKYYTRYLKCNFSALVQLLSKDYMYSPFGYLGYEQSLYNICTTARFIVIDVDHTSTNIHSRLEQLSEEGLDCILGTTSDIHNILKYRVLISLDREVTHHEYRRLVAGVRENGLIPDMDKASQKPSQKFYAYEGAVVLHNQGSPLVVEDYILPEEDVEECNELSCSLELHHLLTELNSYTTASPGNRTRYLLSAAFKLVQLGADDKLLEQTILHLNNAFLIPKDTNSVYRRVINFIKTRRKFLWF